MAHPHGAQACHDMAPVVGHTCKVHRATLSAKELRAADEEDQAPPLWGPLAHHCQSCKCWVACYLLVGRCEVRCELFDFIVRAQLLRHPHLVDPQVQVSRDVRVLRA